MRANRSTWMLLAAMAAVGVLGACSDDGAGPEQPAPLTSQEELVLDEAIQDAYRTYYTYTAVIEDLGAAQPFTAFAPTELASIDALVALYKSRGATPPASVWSRGNVPHFANLQEACMAAEESEVATSLMFERMLMLNLRSEIRGAFEGQRTMARNTHRLGFRGCAGGSVEPLTEAVETSVSEAIQDEYRAFYTYSRVLEDLGDVLPFLQIRDAEWQHVGALANVYEKRDLAVPASTWTLASVPAYGTLEKACAAGVEGEIVNVMMYDRLLLQELPVDVERVFGNLRRASLEQHLPAFQQCAGVGTSELTAEVAAAMEEAIQDEYRAYFTYSGVVEDLEPDFPFAPIRDAEESHYTAIADLFLKRSLAVPASDWNLGNVPHFTTLADACAAGVQGEIDNIAMYDRLLVFMLPTDVEGVFENLRAASEERHLPAFQACAN